MISLGISLVAIFFVMVEYRSCCYYTGLFNNGDKNLEEQNPVGMI